MERSRTSLARFFDLAAVWLRFQDGERSCEGADAEGRLRIASTQATPVVECRVRSARVHAGR